MSPDRSINYAHHLSVIHSKPAFKLFPGNTEEELNPFARIVLEMRDDSHAVIRKAKQNEEGMACMPHPSDWRVMEDGSLKVPDWWLAAVFARYHATVK